MISFRAMNTDVTVTREGPNEARIASRIAAVFENAERRFSRFRDDSELSKLNRAIGPTRVSSALYSALERARGYVELSDGLFDPGIGGPLEALGYDRSFSPGALDRDSAQPPPERGSLLELRLDPEDQSVERPEHVRIDLGGMLKGRTVDDAAKHLDGTGAIDAGGDALMLGPSPLGAVWFVDVEDPRDPARTLATFAVSDAAVATSASNRRAWRAGDATAHHLIDPRTGLPSSSDLLQATVVAPSAEYADVLAKVVFLMGARDGRRFLERQAGLGGVLVLRSGRPMFIGDLDPYEVSDV